MAQSLFFRVINPSNAVKPLTGRGFTDTYAIMRSSGHKHRYLPAAVAASFVSVAVSMALVTCSYRSW